MPHAAEALVIADPVPMPVPVPVPVVAEAPAVVDAGAWAAPSLAMPSLEYAEALRRARDARAELMMLKRGTGEAETKSWYARATALADVASRMYAAAYYAKDASREGRIDAIAEAAETEMALVKRLDEIDLGSLPAAWKSDPAVGGTFEDVAVGPARRWRDEARVLAKQCEEMARELAVETDAARRCATMKVGIARTKITKRDGDGGAPCACWPGDPLCSASLGGWCSK